MDRATSPRRESLLGGRHKSGVTRATQEQVSAELGARPATLERSRSITSQSPDVAPVAPEEEAPAAPGDGETSPRGRSASARMGSSTAVVIPSGGSDATASATRPGPSPRTLMGAKSPRSPPRSPRLNSLRKTAPNPPPSPNVASGRGLVGRSGSGGSSGSRPSSAMLEGGGGDEGDADVDDEELFSEESLDRPRDRTSTINSLDSRVAEALAADDSGGSAAPGAFADLDDGKQASDLETNDQVWGWGNRGIDANPFPTPQPLPDLGGRNVKQVCAGVAHMIMILENGTTYSWGKGGDGRLGHGKNSEGVDVLVPMKVEALASQTIKHVSAGASCGVALNTEGVLFFWGWLGVEESLRIVTPTTVEGLEKQRITHAVCGDNHVLALTFDHTVVSWGLNKQGSLGQGKRELEYVNAPKPVATNQEAIAAGPMSGACVSTSKGVVMYWGPNLKKKAEKPYKKPEKIATKTRIVQVALGAQHMLLLDDLGDVYALGEGAQGQLGTGNYQPHVDPVKVDFPLSREEKLRLMKTSSTSATGDKAAPSSALPSAGPRPAASSTIMAGKFLKAPPAAPGSSTSSSTLRDVAAPQGKKIKSISCGTSSSVALTEEGMVFVWGKIDSAVAESFLQPTLVRALDKIAIEQISANADQVIVLVGLKNERDCRYFSFNPPIVKAASLSKLVERLVSEKAQQDPLFTFAFFVSYDVFSNAADVIGELCARFDRAKAAGDTKLQNRLFAIFMKWIKWRPADFASEQVRQLVDDFLSRVDQAGAALAIRKSIDSAGATDDSGSGGGASAPTRRPTLRLPEPSPGAVDAAAFAKYDALRVAQQLVLVDKVYFDRINGIQELTHQNWMKKDKQNLSPHVLEFIARFNELFYFVVADVLSHDTTELRSSRFQFWADVHKHSMTLSNFNTAVCIASALNSVPIRKLMKRDLIVVKAAQRDALETFRKLLSDRNKTGYRELLAARLDDPKEPAIPYLATMLSDLTFIEEGNQNTVQDGLIHFYKFHLIGKTLDMVSELQKRAYSSVSPDEAIMTALVSVQGLDEEACDKLAEAICAGESVEPLLKRRVAATAAAAAASSPLSLSASVSASSSALPTVAAGSERISPPSSISPSSSGSAAPIASVNERSSFSVHSTTPTATTPSTQSPLLASRKKDVTSRALEALEREARADVRTRADVWSNWLARLDKEGDEFKMLLCSSNAFALTVERVLMDPVKSHETALWQQLLPKFLSPTANVRAVTSLIPSLAPACASYDDVREEAVRLFVSLQYNPLAEGVGNKALGGPSLEALAQRAPTKSAKLLEGVDFSMLEKQVSHLLRDVLQVMAYPPLCELCEYDASGLQRAFEVREAELMAHMEELQQSLGELSDKASGGGGGATDEADPAVEQREALRSRLAELREREAALLEELRVVRESIGQAEAELEQVDAAVTAAAGGPDDEASLHAALDADEEALMTLTQGRDSVHNFLSSIHGPRRQRLMARRDKNRDIALAKAREVSDLLAVLKLGMEICCAEDVPGNESVATFMELHAELGRCVAIYNQISSVLSEVAPDMVAGINDSLAEIAELKARFSGSSKK